MDMTVLGEQRGKAVVTGDFLTMLVLRGSSRCSGSDDALWGMAQLVGTVRFLAASIASWTCLGAHKGAACLQGKLIYSWKRHWQSLQPCLARPGGGSGAAQVCITSRV